MLKHAVQTYLSVRRATGFRLKEVGYHVQSFADYSDAKGLSHVDSKTAIEWARQVPSPQQRARRLADVIRVSRYLHAEDGRHEIPPAVFGSEQHPRRPPYILSDAQIRQLVELAAESGYRNAVAADLQHVVCAPVLHGASGLGGDPTAL